MHVGIPSSRRPQPRRAGAIVFPSPAGAPDNGDRAGAAGRAPDEFRGERQLRRALDELFQAVAHGRVAVLRRRRLEENGCWVARSPEERTEQGAVCWRYGCTMTA